MSRGRMPRPKCSARTRLERPGNPPIRFEIAYDRSRIDPRRRYVVRARILAGGRLLFTTDASYPVLTAGQGNHVTLLLRRAGGAGPAPSGATVSLENTYWKLTRLGDAPVAVIPRQREPHFTLNAQSRRVSGSSGCKRMTGSYELSGDRLTFGQMAGTMMACPNGMDTEQAFLGALTRVDKWKVTRQHLELYDAAGKLVARFEARHMK